MIETLVQVAPEVLVDPDHVVGIAPAPMTTADSYVYLDSGEHMHVPAMKPVEVRQALLSGRARPSSSPLLPLDDDDLPLATVGMPIHKASEGPGVIRSICGGEGYNLAEQWKNVTCSSCKAQEQDQRKEVH